MVNITETMFRLAQDPGLRAQMGEAARKRIVEHFDWDRKGEWITGVYSEVVNEYGFDR